MSKTKIILISFIYCSLNKLKQDLHCYKKKRLLLVTFNPGKLDLINIELISLIIDFNKLINKYASLVIDT